ncbi:protocadherin-9-like isoform X2 [Littorina saxatilis]|uniref:protocadherin-9-like isoform X2 n=1 Tax=Littorina saxatilis TaxID=31220 RepID=UPI0038B60F03
MKCHRYLLALLVHVTLLHLSLAQEDLCEPDFGYETFMMLTEDTEIGKVVLNVTTAGSADDMNLTLVANDYFGFNDTTQQLYVQRQLDADVQSSAPTYRLVINCQEAQKQPVRIAVVITIGDVNDNPPKFDQDHYNISLGETTSVDTLFDPGVIASDADVSFNYKAVYYTVQPGGLYSDYFQFPNTLEPNLLLRKALDFETLPNMTITVVATNDLSDIKLSSTALLTIVVTDEDDLNPVFTSPLYEGFVLADAAMNSPVNVTPDIRAADADVTLDVPVVYSFHDQIFLFDRDARGSQNVFAINETTAQVRLVAPIRPTKVSMVVQATQKDNPSRYGVAMLVITVGGVNSNAPKFQSDRYPVYVSESVPVGTTILFVSATDEDFGAAIRYSIVGGSSLFAVAENSGAIHVTAPLDFETTPLHTFSVMASDGNMNSTATVKVTVVDSNDNAPIIPDKQQTFDAERKKGEVITTIKAQDADAGTRLNYSIVNYKRLFSIDESGAIRISAEPSELTEAKYLLVVVVSDNGEPPRVQSVLVTVKFSPLSVTQATVMAGPSDDTLAIALGVIAALLLVVVIILVVYICRRRNKNTEQLDKAKANRSQDPRGLKFKNANRAQMDHIHFQSDDSLDGATTIQENPLKEAGAFNYGFVHPEDPENDRNMDEIHIETAVIPYQDANAYKNNNNNGGEMFQHEDSSDYGDTLPHKHSLMNGLYPDTSTESLSTTHTNSSSEGGDGGSKHRLMGNGTTSIGTTSFSSNPIGTTSFSMKRGGDGGGGGSHGSALPAISLEGLDPDVSVVPAEQKSELTVYF